MSDLSSLFSYVYIAHPDSLRSEYPSQESSLAFEGCIRRRSIPLAAIVVLFHSTMYSSRRPLKLRIWIAKLPGASGIKGLDPDVR
jgi:hypothetical protein